MSVIKRSADEKFTAGGTRALRLLGESREELRHPMEMIDMIGRRVSGETEQLEAARMNLAELLHPTRSPTQHRSSVQPKRAK